MCRFRSRRRGAVYAFVALGMLAMLGMAALSVDMSVIVLARGQLQTACDAAALAGVSIIQTSLDVTQASNAAVSTAALNTVLGKAVTIDPAVDVSIGAYDPQTAVFKAFDTSGGAVAIPDGVVAVKVQARRTTGSPDGPIPLYFAKALGINSAQVTTHSMAGLTVCKRVRTPVEASICQDMSGSFYDEFGDAKTGDSKFVDFMMQCYATGDRTALAGFGYQPYSSDSSKKKDTYYFYDFALNSNDNVSGGASTTESHINGMTGNTLSSNTGTNMWTGLLRCFVDFEQSSVRSSAWTTFINNLSSTGTFEDIGWWNSSSSLRIGSTTKTRKTWLYGYIDTLLNQSYDNTSAEHVIILVSDGMPYYHLNGYPDAASKQLCQDIADKMAAKGVKIHTVTLDQESVPADGSKGADAAFNASMVRNGGFAFYTYDSAKLANLLVGVGQVEVGQAHLMN